MYCSKCGAEVTDNQNWCAHCGEKICRQNLKTEHNSFVNEKSNQTKEDSEYLFNGFLREFDREKIIKIMKIIHYVLLALVTIKILQYFFGEIQGNQHYKIFLYIVRFINTVGIYCILEYVSKEFLEILELKRNQLKNRYTVKEALLMRALAIVFYVLGFINLFTNSTEKQYKVFQALAEDSIRGYLEVFTVGIILIIISEAIDYIWNEKMIEK